MKACLSVCQSVSLSHCRYGIPAPLLAYLTLLVLVFLLCFASSFIGTMKYLWRKWVYGEASYDAIVQRANNAENKFYVEFTRPRPEQFIGSISTGMFTTFLRKKRPEIWRAKNLFNSDIRRDCFWSNPIPLSWLVKTGASIPFLRWTQRRQLQQQRQKFWGKRLKPEVFPSLTQTTILRRNYRTYSSILYRTSFLVRAP